jgi:hypothetical protein
MASFYPDLYQTALALLIEARERAGLTQEALAAWFGQSEAFVSSYEDGARRDCSIQASISRSPGRSGSTRTNCRSRQRRRRSESTKRFRVRSLASVRIVASSRARDGRGAASGWWARQGRAGTSARQWRRHRGVSTASSRQVLQPNQSSDFLRLRMERLSRSRWFRAGSAQHRSMVRRFRSQA